MHESIAKAKLKGEIRISTSSEKDVLNNIKHKHFAKPLLSNKKGINKYIKTFTDMSSNSIINEKHHIRRTSWHYKYEFLAFQNDFSSVENYGSFKSIMIHTFYTRKLINIKKKKQGHIQAVVKAFCHEHFFIRFMQRVGALNVGDVGKQIYPIIEWLIMNNVPMKHIPENSYLVCQDYVLIATRLPHSEGLLFKTVLMRDQMTDEQKRLFTDKQNLMDNSEIFAYLANDDGTILRTIPKVNNDSLTTVDVNVSNWLSCLEDEINNERE